MQQDFIIRQWSVWSDQDDIAEPKELSANEILAAVPKMLKRRFSPLAKIVQVAVALSLSNDQCMPMVLSSCHGELAKSFKMMQQIEAGEEISPTAFSLSVHNAIAGLLSMNYKNRLQTTVLAPGEEGIAPAFIEALGLLHEGEEQVLIVFYDEPVVDFYPTETYRLGNQERCAVALRIALDGTGMAVKMSDSVSSGNDGEQPIQLPRLIDFLGSENITDLIVKTPRHSWCWNKC